MAVEELHRPIACGPDTLHAGKERLPLRGETNDYLSNALPRFTKRHRCGDGRRGRSPPREIEQQFAPRKLEIAIDCFELNPGKSDLRVFSMSTRQIEPGAPGHRVKVHQLKAVL